MNSDRIKEIQETTAYPESVSVQQALLQVWNECEQFRPMHMPTEEESNREMCKEGQFMTPISEYDVPFSQGWNQCYKFILSQVKPMTPGKENNQ